MTRTRRRFSKEFKQETVKLVKEGPRSVGEVAGNLDLTESAVRNWVRQFDVNAGVREGVSTSERDELRRLRQYFPKGTDLNRHSANDIAAVAATLNRRPRQTLGWRTPSEALNELLLLHQRGRVATTP